MTIGGHLSNYKIRVKKNQDGGAVLMACTNKCYAGRLKYELL